MIYDVIAHIFTRATYSEYPGVSQEQGKQLANIAVKGRKDWIATLIEVWLTSPETVAAFSAVSMPDVKTASIDDLTDAQKDAFIPLITTVIICDEALESHFRAAMDYSMELAEGKLKGEITDRINEISKLLKQQEPSQSHKILVDTLLRELVVKIDKCPMSNEEKE